MSKKWHISSDFKEKSESSPQRRRSLRSFPSKATVYAPVCTTNPQILIVICCTHLHIHHMSRILFLILSFLPLAAILDTRLVFMLSCRGFPERSANTLSQFVLCFNNFVLCVDNFAFFVDNFVLCFHNFLAYRSCARSTSGSQN